MVYIILGTGFEEAEALVTADVLRRGGVGVALTAVEGSAATGAHGITVCTDTRAEQVELRAGDMVLLPGGMGGVESMEGSASVMALAREAMEREELWLAAICAAPTLLARKGIIGAGCEAVCYPGMEEYLTAAGVTARMELPAVRRGRLITGKGPGTVFDFALAVLETLTDGDTAAQVRADLHYGI